MLIMHAAIELVSRFKLPRPQLRRERVEHGFLNRTFERARAGLLVVAFAGEQLLRGGVHVEREILLREALFQSPEQDDHFAHLPTFSITQFCFKTKACIIRKRNLEPEKRRTETK